jgi:hypothetical protein
MTTTTQPRTPASPSRRSRSGRGRPVLVTLLVLLLVAGTAGWVWWRGSIGTVPIRPHCTATALGNSTELDPEQAGNAAIIASVAVRRGLAGRAATIGIATAMQESKLVNLPGGDRDSIGLFQQRPSQGWGTPAQVRDPVYATNAFYDVLVKVEGYQSLPITAAAQKVQRSAFPAAYADHEPEARILASTLSGFSPAAFSCVLPAADPGPERATGSSGLVPRAENVVQAADRETGRTGKAVPGAPRQVRFTLGGKTATSDAWALAQWAVARADALGVVAVETSGRRWDRTRPDRTWTPVAGTPSGTVVVTVG